MVVVKTEDQACGGSLPFYPFVEGMFHVLAWEGQAQRLPRRYRRAQVAIGGFIRTQVSGPRLPKA